MVRVETSEDLVSLQAGPIRVTFGWDGRRWAHDLRLDDRRLASSVEWEPERDDPSRVVSPAYQQIGHQAPGGDEAQALLVGQYGPHHCSGVFTMSTSTDRRARLSIDVAIRSRSNLEVVAATYSLPLGSSDLLAADPREIAWRLEGASPGRLVLGLGPDDDARLALAESGRRSTRVQAVGALRAGTSTQRLYYHWRWLPD